jgi:hypothetical protein
MKIKILKKTLFLILILSAVNNCFAQELLKRTRRVTPTVTEKYSYTIGTDREIKQGLYQALYKKKFALASGKYVDDKKVGVWHFFNRQGALIENYDYDTNTLKHEAAEENDSTFKYVFDAEFGENDALTKPVRPGGRYFGYIPYLTTFKLPKYINFEDIPEYGAILEILVSPGGRLADFKIHLNAPWEEDRVISVNINRMSEEDKKFIPATLNKNPVASRIAIKCFITPQQTLEIL